MSESSVAIRSDSPWIVSPRWGFLFLIAGVVFVPLPLLIKNGFGLSVTLVNLIVTILVV